MLQHVEKLRLLRDDIDAGVRSLDAGKGSEVDMRGVVSRYVVAATMVEQIV